MLPAVDGRALIIFSNKAAEKLGELTRASGMEKIIDEFCERNLAKPKNIYYTDTRQRRLLTVSRGHPPTNYDYIILLGG